jgi:hypothetical protein
MTTGRSGFDFSLERIYGTGLKNPLATVEAGLRGFFKSGFNFLLLMKTVR